MARRPVAMMGIMQPDCTREGYLREQQAWKEDEKVWKDCKKRREWPGYERLMDTRIRRGEDV